MPVGKHLWDVPDKCEADLMCCHEAGLRRLQVVSTLLHMCGYHTVTGDVTGGFPTYI